MVNEANIGRRRCHGGVEPLLALRKRQRAQVLGPCEKLVEDEEHKVTGIALGECRLQGGEIRHAVVIQGHHLAVDDAFGQMRPRGDDFGKLFGPIETLAGQQLRRARLDAQLHAIAVELDLVGPAGPGWGFCQRPTKLRLDESGYLGNGFPFGG